MPTLAATQSFTASFFVARGVPVEEVMVTEGRLFIAEIGELSALGHRLSPSGKAGLTAFLEVSGC
jgi:hypothetical protein